MSMKERILFLLPLPPPLHGASSVSESIMNSERINASFHCRYANIATSRDCREIGVFRPWSIMQKLMRFLTALIVVFRQLVIFHPHKCYMAITCHGVGFLKDAPFALLARAFGCKLILHHHNKGMQSCSHHRLYRILLSAVYRNATVILLSPRLYDDVSDIVDKKSIRICPNGI